MRLPLRRGELLTSIDLQNVLDTYGFSYFVDTGGIYLDGAYIGCAVFPKQPKNNYESAFNKVVTGIHLHKENSAEPVKTLKSIGLIHEINVTVWDGCA